MSHTNFLSWLLGAMFAFSVCLTSDLPAQETEKAPSTEQEKEDCLLYTSPSPRDLSTSRMPSSA